MFGNNRGTNLKEVIFIIVMFTFLLLPFVITKQWWWVAFLGAVVIIFGILEAASKIKTGKTLSQSFWKYSEEHKVGSIICLLSLAIGWVLLLLHLAWKMIK